MEQTYKWCIYRSKRQKFDSAGGRGYLGVLHDGVVDGLEGRGDVLHHGGRDTGQETGLHGGHHGVELSEIAHETDGGKDRAVGGRAVRRMHKNEVVIGTRGTSRGRGTEPKGISRIVGMG